MSTSHPRLLAWRDNDDLIYLRSLYTSSSKESLQKAVSITISYESKCSIPHSITSTKQLTLLKMQFDSLNSNSTGGAIHLLQSSATMTLIRFVNGLLDPFQQSQYAIPLSVLARRIGLPSKFIELRHMGTHEGLPSLEMLEITVNEALEWLFQNYWSGIEKEEREQDILMKQLAIESKSVKSHELKEQIKKYRRIRRNDINKLFKYGDSSDAGKEYWGLIKEIKTQVGLIGFNDVLIERIISPKVKFENLKKLYEPLMKALVRMDEDDEFVVGFIDGSMKKLYEYEKLKKTDFLKGEEEFKQLKSWLGVVLEYDYTGLMTIKLIDVISKHSMKLSIELLDKLQLKNEDLIQKRENRLEFLNNLLNNNSSALLTKREIDNIDDITNDLENLKKKVKLNKKESIPVKLFEQCKDWKPKPFGVI